MTNKTLLLALLLVSACHPFQGVAPDGFAAFEPGKSYRAVSPDGVLFRVRAADNKPKADLPFWKEAFKKRMLDSGYSFTAEANVATTSGTPGYMLELAAPIGVVDYGYIIAIFEHGDDIIIAEAAGDVVKLAARRQAVVDAITQLKLN